MISEEEKKSLAEYSVKAKENSYSPYSKFRVGAAVLVQFKKSGERKIFTGCNVENCAYPLSTCAERVAITKAKSEGMCDDDTLLAVACATDLTDRFCSPCGGCRQIIAEFGHSNDCLILLVNPSKEIKEITIKTLLPNAFNPKILLSKK